MHEIACPDLKRLLAHRKRKLTLQNIELFFFQTMNMWRRSGIWLYIG
jgi:hypothetical protein